MVPRWAYVLAIQCTGSKGASYFWWMEDGAPCTCGANGTLLKSCCPSSTWKADSCGWTREVHNMFSVPWDCLINFHHKMDGKSSSYMQRPEMVWFLKVWIARSAAVARWSYGVTNCTLIFSLLRYALRAFVATLSMTLKTGLKPRLERYVMFSLKHYTIVSTVASFIGIFKMA